MSDRIEGTGKAGETGRSAWTAFRVALFVSGLWLLGYVVYRYTLFNPPEHGTVYGTIFPAALILALTGLVLAARPGLLGRRSGPGAGALKAGLSGFGILWMATGLHCTLSLLDGMAAAPLGGTIDMVHMVSDHVFLPVSVGVLAWAPGWLAGKLGDTLDDGGLAAPFAGKGALGEAGAGRSA